MHFGGHCVGIEFVVVEKIALNNHFQVNYRVTLTAVDRTMTDSSSI